MLLSLMIDSQIDTNGFPTPGSKEITPGCDEFYVHNYMSTM